MVNMGVSLAQLFTRFVSSDRMIVDAKSNQTLVSRKLLEEYLT